jgi:hypothetical protein
MPCVTTDPLFQLEFLDSHPKNIVVGVDHPYLKKEPGFDGILVLLVREPDAILHIRQVVIDNHTNFDYIFTHDQAILNACPNARLYLFGTTWIPPEVYNNINIHGKQLKISCLTGSKELTPAHAYRKMLYNQQNTIPFLPVTWFRSSKGMIMPKLGNNPIIGDSKVPLFLDYQYSVVIENCRENNYFTEKLIDCLITKTIPIYYGCPNISNWFDTRGWIILETMSIQEFRAKCGKLPNYHAHINVINENFERAKQYSDLKVNLQRVMNFGD